MLADQQSPPAAPEAIADPRIAAAVDTFRREGVAVIADVIDPVLLARCREEVLRDYPQIDAERRDFDQLWLGDKRFTVPLTLVGGLADLALIAHPLVLAVARELLGAVCLLDSFGLLVSLPGAPDQAKHHDAKLYPETTLDRLLPPTAIALAIPLTPMDAVSGSTQFWSRSHRAVPGDGPPDFAPVVEPGSVLLWDYRITHRGGANLGDTSRLVLFGAYCREWWNETTFRYGENEKFFLPQALRDSLDEPTRKLLGRGKVVA